jgi:hypothetical protein
MNLDFLWRIKETSVRQEGFLTDSLIKEIIWKKVIQYPSGRYF